MRIGSKDVKPNPDDPKPADRQAGESPSLDDGGLDEKYGAPKEFDWSKVRNKKQRLKDEKKRQKEEEAAAAEEEAVNDPAKPGLRFRGKPIKQEHAIAGAVIGTLMAVSVIYYYMRSTDELAPLMTVEQAAQLKGQQQRGDRDSLEKLIKEVGPDHPQVIQMKMELGDIPFPKNK